MHPPSMPYATAPALPGSPMEEVTGPDHSSSAGVRYDSNQYYGTASDGSTAPLANLGYDSTFNQNFIGLQPHPVANTHYLGVANPLDCALHQAPAIAVNNDQLYDATIPYLQSHSAALTNNFGTVNPLGPLPQVPEIAISDDQPHCGFNGTYPQYQATPQFNSPFANNLHQTSYRIGPQAVDLQTNFAYQPFSTNGSGHFSMAEAHFGSNPTLNAAPALDSGYGVPAVTTGARGSANTGLGAVSNLTTGSYDPPTALTRADGQSSIRTSRERGSGYQTIKLRAEGPLRCKWDNCSSTSSFKREEELVRHVKIYHISPTRYICDAPGCGKEVYRQDKMEEHVRKHHR
ncbi:hypothetical protein MMC22_010577 [Lobaria immixta]|nr:hypothetical protein [Lobaria immixta]